MPNRSRFYRRSIFLSRIHFFLFFLARPAPLAPSSFGFSRHVIDPTIGDDECRLFFGHQGRVEDLRDALLSLALLQHHAGRRGVGEHMTPNWLYDWTKHCQRSRIRHALVDDHHGDIKFFRQAHQVTQMLAELLLAFGQLTSTRELYAEEGDDAVDDQNTEWALLGICRGDNGEWKRRVSGEGCEE